MDPKYNRSPCVFTNHHPSLPLPFLLPIWPYDKSYSSDVVPHLATPDQRSRGERGWWEEWKNSDDGKISSAQYIGEDILLLMLNSSFRPGLGHA